MPATSRIFNKLSILLRLKEFSVFISLLSVTIAFTLLSKEFLTVHTFAGILTLASELGIVAIGEAFLIISGEFDLSVGSVYAVSAMASAILVRLGISPIIALLLALLLSASIGAANGLITLKARIPSFITTLGMAMFLRGILLAVTGGFPVELGVRHPVFEVLSGRIFGDFRSSALWFITLTILFHFILNRTRYGNWVYATGRNPNIARALGVNIFRVKFTNFIVTSTLAGLSGCIALARFRIIEPVAGTGLELEAIAATVIGGTSLGGGIGTIIGASLGAFLVGMIRVGLVLAGAPAYWYIGFVGLILIVAAVIYSLTRGRGLRYV